ncbi:2-acylglycerol O-acyltransferase 2-A [Trichinella papuae]|uniref:diacylglycerol O-acyltransferase n=1 Tax=Trichinella papuae TaxID=268474 RepID=A0A0V1MSG1_9BILA|nr:2-acylglycerol O-acyltransferase 2-A [Trichinella papuae]
MSTRRRDSASEMEPAQSDVGRIGADPEETNQPTPPGVLLHHSTFAVQVIISISPDDCKAVGFTPNLVCSSCSELSQYGLKELEPNCRQCCAKDELNIHLPSWWCVDDVWGSTRKSMSEKPKEWPGFRVRYERGANPVIKLFNENKEVVETLGIDKWNTDTIVEFLSERGAVKGRKTWVALDVHENRILIIVRRRQIFMKMDFQFVLQALAILFHVFFMVLYPPISCFLIYKLLRGGYFAILLGYLIWLIYDWQTPSQGSRLSMALRRAYYMKLCQQYFPITLRKTAELDPSKNYIIGHHPHGILSFGATNFCQEYSDFSSLFPGMRSYLSTLKMNFLFPIRREYFEFLGVTDCSKSAIQYLLSKPRKGTAVAVVIGGAEEALEAHPGKHRVVLKSRKGFIKLALRCGTLKPILLSSCQAVAVLFNIFVILISPLPILYYIYYILMYTSYWWVMMLYFLWYLYDYESPRRGSHLFMCLRRCSLFKCLADYFPVYLKKTAPLSPRRNYLIANHPHGITAAGLFANFLTEATGFSDAYPGITTYPGTLDINFLLPFRREYMLMLGAISCGRESVKYMLSKPAGGHAVVLAVGGAEEALEAHPGASRIILKSRKGFVRLALICGASLVPSYSFGEVDVFNQINNEKGSLLRRVQDWFRKIATFSTPIFYGSYIFLPYRRPICTVVGRPIDVEKCEDPTQEQIDRLHEIYVNELLTLFNKYKVSYGLPESAQLEIL